MLHDAKANLSVFEVPFIVNAPVTASNEKMKVGNFEINWLHLPGHCPGSSMIYLPKESVIFLVMCCSMVQLEDLIFQIHQSMIQVCL